MMQLQALGALQFEGRRKKFEKNPDTIVATIEEQVDRLSQSDDGRTRRGAHTILDRVYYESLNLPYEVRLRLGRKALTLADSRRADSRPTQALDNLAYHMADSVPYFEELRTEKLAVMEQSFPHTSKAKS